MNKGLQLLAVVCALVCLAEFSRGQNYGNGGIRPRPRPLCGPIYCRMRCQNGVVIVRGCPICRCRPVLETRVRCPRGSRQRIPRTPCTYTRKWQTGSIPTISICGQRGFCQPAAADGVGLCCTRRRTIPVPTPGKPRVRCPRGSRQRIPRTPCTYTRKWQTGSIPTISICGQRGFCQPAAADGVGLCCTRRRTIPVPTPEKPRVRCSRGSRQIIPRIPCTYTQKWQTGSIPTISICGQRGFCQPAAADGVGLCCTRRRTIPVPTPGRCPRVIKRQCLFFKDDCKQPCRRGRRCCPTMCDQACTRVSTGIEY